MKFKNYSREYERVFTGDELIKKKCDIDKVSVHNNVLSKEKYQLLYKETVKKYYLDTFNSIIRMVWLRQHFCYRGTKRKKSGSNGYILDTAYGVFTRHFLNFDSRFVFAGVGPYGKVASYFDDFFPNFEEGNPFEEDYVYPYKYMTLECLVVVYQMEERLELLKEGEKKHMSYTEFLDYVLNYINCYNEEHEDSYLFVFSHVFIPYIKKI